MKERKRLKKLLFMMLALIMAVVAVGCGQAQVANADEEQEKQEKKLHKITLSEPVRAELWAPNYLAQTLGFYEDEGLEVEILSGQKGKAPTLVLTREVDMGLFGPELPMKLRQEDKDVKLIFTSTDKYPYVFVGAPDIKSTKDLKGKAVNGADPSSSPRAFVNSLIRQEGYEPNKDVNVISVIDRVSYLAAMKSGELAGTYTCGAEKVKLMNEGCNLIVDTYNPQTHKEILGSSSYEMYITFATEEFIKENPEAVQKYVNAAYRALKWLNEHSAEEVTDELIKSFPERDREDMLTTIKEYKEMSVYSDDGSFSESGVKAINRMAQASGLIEKETPYEEVVESSFIEKAHEKYGN
jgi:NitT/TauT family transport system substrate-binding protein